MAVAHSASSESHTGATGSVSQASFSWTHTQTGTPQGVLVFVHTISASDFVSSVTYGGVTLTRVAGAVAIDTAGEPGRTDFFFAGSGLSSGNQTITVNRTSNATIMYASAATVTAGANVNVANYNIRQENQTLVEVSVDDGSSGIDGLRYAAAYYGANSPAPAGANSTLLTSIDLGSFGNSMVVETTAGQGSRPVGFQGGADDLAAVFVALREVTAWSTTGETGSFLLTGNDATFTIESPKMLTAELGTFAFTGSDANFAQQYKITIDAGGFALAGNDATLSKTSPKGMVVEAGAFSLAGQPADTRHNVRIESGTGSFSVTGNPATLTEAAAAKTLAADRGEFTLIGNAASTLVAVQLGGDVGKFFLPERNLLKWSEQFNQSPWTLTGASITVNQALAPDGLPTGDLLTCTATGNFSGRVSLVGRSGQIATFSVYAKKAASDWLHITLGGAPGNVARRCWYNLATGIVGGTSSASGGGGTLLQQSMVAVGNGWYRCVLAADAGAGLTWTSTTFFQPADNDLTTSSTLGNSIYLWGAQLEQVSAVSDYDPTGPAGATDTSLQQQYKLTAEVGTFAFTGNSATLAKGRTITTETGTFTATGQPATLRHNPRIEANTGSFALSGGAPALLRGRYLSGGAGEFIETGQPATFRRTWAVQAATGAFSFTGNPASLTELGAYEISAVVGAFTLSGQAVNLAQSQTMPVDAGTFSLTGQPATLRQSRALTAETGSFATTGQPASLTQGYRLDAGTGAFSVTGQPATLVKQSAKQLTADAGVFTFAGQQATLTAGRRVAADRGLFTLTGQPATLRHNPALTAQAGSFNLAGQPATLRIGHLLPVQAGAFNLTGNSANLTDTDELYPSAGVFAFTGQPASLIKTSTARRRNVLIF